MARKAAIILILVMVTVGVVGLALIQRVRAAGQTWIVISTGDSGPGTLRSFLANATTGDTIIFDSSVFPPASPVNIKLSSELPHIIRGNLTIDASGAGVILNGSGILADTVGLVVDSESNTIKGLQILNFSGWGIRLTANARVCSISGNTITNNGNGIELYESSNNTISGNTITNNVYGVGIMSSLNNSITENTFVNCGLAVIDSYKNHVKDNLVNGKQLVYLENVSNYTVENAGQVILVNCSRILMENLDLSNTTFGVELLGTNNTKIARCNMTNNESGIWLRYSSNNTILGNNITNNKIGIRLENSSRNTLIGNTASNNSQYGIYLPSSSNNTLTGNNASNNGAGIFLLTSNNNTLSGNNVEGNSAGISVDGSMNNVISGNNVVNNTNGIDIVGVLFTVISGNHIAANTQYGITLDAASNNTISANNVTNNNLGIFLDGLCNNNTIYHNHFINNTQQVIVSLGDVNTWDNGYPSGGNYWSDYTDVDQYSGPDQNEPGSDEIWDHPYIIDENNQDNYPIVPEFPSFLILPIFMIATLLAVMVYKRKRSTS